MPYYLVYFTPCILFHHRNAIHESSSRVVRAFPHMALVSSPVVRLLVDSPFEPVAVFMIDDVGIDIIPLSIEIVDVYFFLRVYFREEKERIEAFGLGPPVFCVFDDGAAIISCKIISAVVESADSVVPAVC